MEKYNKGAVHNLGTRIFLGFIFSVFSVPAIVLDLIVSIIILGIVLKGGGHVSSKAIFFFTRLCWNAIGDCVENEKIGTNWNMVCKDYSQAGWFLRALRRSKWWNSFPMEIIKSVFCFCISSICFGASGFAGYLFAAAIISSTLAPELAVFLLAGIIGGLGGGIFLIWYGCHKISKAFKNRKQEQSKNVKILICYEHRNTINVDSSEMLKYKTNSLVNNNNNHSLKIFEAIKTNEFAQQNKGKD